MTEKPVTYQSLVCFINFIMNRIGIYSHMVLTFKG
ncbi:unnamed protein product [Debaryomyces fabryi]|nr:unnamed protein product [Debaryomyces fabryi]